MDSHAVQALLEWQVELGATEAIGDAPVNRYEISGKQTKMGTSTVDQPAKVASDDPVAVARQMSEAAQNLDDLREALAAFEHCDLKRGAHNLVFSDGQPNARVMIIGEAPGRDEDQQGKPFVGRAGQLLDKMFAAIGMSRASPDAKSALYITNILPWRPPQNRDPEALEIAMMLPFVERHIFLADPDILVFMGNISCQALLGRKGITRLRGNWAEAQGRPVLPMFHPAYLLRNPAAKREAWHDLLMLQARLRST